MFETDIMIKGKHATYLKFLSSKTEQNDKNAKTAGVFDRNIDVFLVAPLFGLIYNRKADEDKSSDDKTKILTEQIIREQSKLKFIYRLVNLADNSQGLSDDDKINLTFRQNGNEELFYQYLRGGIEYLYEFFTDDNAVTKSDYYERMVKLITSIQEDEDANYEEQLKNLKW